MPRASPNVLEWFVKYPTCVHILIIINALADDNITTSTSHVIPKGDVSLNKDSEESIMQAEPTKIEPAKK